MGGLIEHTCLVTESISRTKISCSWRAPVLKYIMIIDNLLFLSHSLIKIMLTTFNLIIFLSNEGLSFNFKFSSLVNWKKSTMKFISRNIS